MLRLILLIGCFCFSNGLFALAGNPPDSGSLSSKLQQIRQSLDENERREVFKLKKQLMAAGSPEERLKANLSLALYYQNRSPKLAQQYLAAALAEQDPFAEDMLVFATSSFFRIQLHSDNKLPGSMVRELERIIASSGLPWKMLKRSYEMLLTHYVESKQEIQYNQLFERYLDAIPAFAIDQKLHRDYVLFLKTKAQNEKYLKELVSLASHYPMQEESRWAFENLLQLQREEPDLLTGVSLNYLRRVYLNSVLDPSVKDSILAFLDLPIQPSPKANYRRPLSGFEKTKFLLRVREYDKALALSDKINREGSSQLLRDEARFWNAHILAASGQFEKANEAFKKSDLSKAGSFFLESYASNLMRVGDYEEAALVFEKALRENPNYRLRWYQFWSLDKAQKFEKAKALINQNSSVFHSALPDKDSKNYWSFIVDRKAGRSMEKPTFSGPVSAYYETLTQLKLEDKQESEFSYHLPQLDRLQPIAFRARKLIDRKLGESRKPLAYYASTQIPIEIPPEPITDEQVSVDLPYMDEVRIISETLDIDPLIFYALMKAESAFNPLAHSQVGARGIMQLMPYTALKLSKLLRDESFSLEALSDPIKNITYGGIYFKMLFEAAGRNTFLALAAYNAGPQATYSWLRECRNCEIDEFVESIDYPETRNYVKKVWSYYATYHLQIRGQWPSHGSQLPEDTYKHALGELF